MCAILDERFPNSDYIPHESLINFVADRPGHDRRYAMDSGKIKRELDWSPKESIDSGLRKTIEWYLTHSDWVSTIQDRSTYQKWLEANYDTRGEAK